MSRALFVSRFPISDPSALMTDLKAEACHAGLLELRARQLTPTRGASPTIHIDHETREAVFAVHVMAPDDALYYTPSPNLAA